MPPVRVDPEVAREMYADGVSALEIARFFGVSDRAIYHHVFGRESRAGGDRSAYNARRRAKWQARIAAMTPEERTEHFKKVYAERVRKGHVLKTKKPPAAP